MPRRTYAADRRRRQAPGDNTLRWLEEELHRRQAWARTPTLATELRHHAYCTDPNVGTFIGIRGDHMERCHTCRAVAVIRPAQQ